VLKFFANQGVHRVAVVRREDMHRILGVVSQSGIMRFLYRHQDLLLPHTLASVGSVLPRLHGAQTLLSVPDTATVRHAVIARRCQCLTLLLMCLPNHPFRCVCCAVVLLCCCAVVLLCCCAVVLLCCCAVVLLSIVLADPRGAHSARPGKDIRCPRVVCGRP
jgi:hypothetical protein